MKKSELQKEVCNLGRELEEKNYKIKRLESDIRIYKGIIENHQPERSHAQTNVCKRGPWCKACVFRESYTMSRYSERLDICMRHMACEGFTPVKESSDD